MGKQPLSLKEACDRCMLTVYRGTRAEVSAQAGVDGAIEFFSADRELATIRTADLDGYVHFMKHSKHYEPASINRRLGTLSRVFTFAEQRDLVNSRPHFPRQAKVQGRLRWLTRDEECAMVWELDNAGFREQAGALMVLADTGLRPSELWNLDAGDIGTVGIRVVKSKTDRPRLVPMTERVRVMMEGRTGKVFPYSNNWFAKAWHLGRMKLGLLQDPEFVPYCLRHTFASRLIQGGVPVDTVSRLLGHSNIQQTMQYAHLSEGNLASAINVLEHIRA